MKEKKFSPSNQQHSLESVTAYINAGGQGARLRSLGSIPHDSKGRIAKALEEVGPDGERVKLLDHQIAWIASSGMSKVVVGAGNLENVARYSNEVYSDNDTVHAVTTETQLGTGGDLVQAVRKHPELFNEHVFVSNVDTVLELNIAEFVKEHLSGEDKLTFALTRASDVPNWGKFYISEDGKVLFSAEAQDDLEAQKVAASTAAWRASSTGAVVINTDFLRNFNWKPSDGKLSLYSDIVGVAIAQHTLGSYDAGRNFMLDIGTDKTYQQARTTGILKPYLWYPDRD